jgi:two-component system CheB/CheR fusion protein
VPQAFSVVGIGASAGGLEALQRFFERVPTDSGLAYVVVQHLSPDFKSLMEELLRRHTAVPIQRVVDGVTVEPNVIYLIPPNTDMIITSGRLHLTERDPEQALTLPIDLFFRSLAQDVGERAIAVVLSGSGSDGSRGVRAIHEAGGLVVVQDERTAKFDGMPRSSIDTGVADLVLPPAAIPDALVLHARRGLSGRAARAADDDVSKDELDGLGPIFALLRREYGIDFTHYKPTTVVRRIQRRLVLSEIGDLATYTQRLQQEPDELDALYRDLLIGVTRFFRDPEAFARLRECIGPLMQRLEPDEELRVWCAACATGEEAYTVAMVALESMRVLGRKPRLKVFATDAHRTSLEVSGAGRYNAESVRALPQELRDRYFQPQGEGWVVRSELRSHVVFAPHNVLRDAPFTRLDLITCRNLLIYFQPQAQRKVLSLFHFALKAGGVLLLGPSETPGDLGDEFQSIDDHWKLYRKRRDIRLPTTDTRLTSPPEFLPRPRRAMNKLGSYEQALVDAQERLLREYAPATLLVDEHGELLHTFKGAGAYLTNRDGPTSLSVLDLVHRDLKFAVAHGLKRAFDKREDSVFPGVRVRNDEGEQLVEVSVRAVVRGDVVEAGLISIREEASRAQPPTSIPGLQAAAPEEARLVAERIDQLELELRQTKENLQATIEEMETSNEELQATNEELIASNEELQSTNEELHSVNEELYTVNAEHQQKIAELTELTNDMDNLLASTEVHTLFLDADLRLRKFTPKIAETFHLLPQDVGRRIESFTHTVQHEGLLDDIRRTLAEGVTIEREVRDLGGRDYLLRVLPYRAREKADGVVFTLVDVSTLKRTEQALQTSVERYRTLVRSLATAVWTTDATGGFVEPQPEWEVFTGQAWPAYAGMDWLVAVHPADREAVAGAWRAGVERREVFEAGGRLSSRQAGEFRWVVMRAAPLLEPDGEVREWVGTLTDRHRERVAEHERRQIERQLQGLLDNSPAFIHAKDPQGRYVLANPQARIYAGANPEEVLGKTDMDLLPPEAAEEVRGNDRRVATTGLVHEFEETLPGPGGVPRTYLSIKWPLRDEEGKLTAVAGISSDISERRRAAEENRMGLERRDRFLAMLSHELRNPLAAALNAVYTLGRADLSERLRGRAPQIIRRQIEHMGRLLDDLLDVARLTQDRITVRREPVDLKRVLTHSVEASSDLLRSADVRLDVAVCDEPAWVDGDAARLQQVITNLLSNASKYTPSGGSVIVHLERRGASVAVRVKDTGVGLERAQLSKVFELFYQVDSSIERARGGLGVGLSLVRTIVGLHGGLVSGYSEGLGKGSEFTVSLPAIDAPAPVAAAGGVVAGRASMKVVVVEDNGDGRELLTEVLRESGFEVAAAADGVAGVETILTFRPHVAFVDLGLPRLDGYEVARRVRASATRGSVHLVAVTGYGRPEDQRRALEAGFDEHMVKPLSPDLVLSVLERARPRTPA